MTNVVFLHADAQIHPFGPASFDASISHTGAMFFGDPPAAFANIARALRAGAPLTLLVWQPPQANDWIRDLTEILAVGRQLPAPPTGVPGPFSLAEPDHAQTLLETSGFGHVTVEGLHEQMWFGTTPEDALRLITGLGAFAALLRDFEPDAREGALAQLRDSISAHHTGDGVQCLSAMWIITATRQ